MIRIEGIPIVAERLAAAEKEERLKRRRAMLKVSRTASRRNGRKEVI